MANWDSFQLKIEDINETKVNMINLLFQYYFKFRSQFFCFKYVKDEKGAVEEVIYGWVWSLDGRIPDCKLGMHAKCFSDVQKYMIDDPESQYNGGWIQLDRLKSCCHHRLRDLCVHTDGVWWKLKKDCDQKDIGNYPDVCIICLKSFLLDVCHQ